MKVFGGDTWDTTSNAKFLVAYSNDNRVATSSNQSFVRNLISHTTGKWYVELTVQYNTDPNDRYRVGIVSHDSQVLVDFPYFLLGDDAGSVAWDSSGDSIFNNYISKVGKYTNNDVLCIACDFDNSKVWFRVNGGPWADQENSIPNVSDPTTGSGGLDITSMAHKSKFIAVMLSNGSAISINPVMYTAPTRFLNWINPYSLFETSGSVILPLPHANSIMFSNGYTAIGNPLPLSITAHAPTYEFDPYHLDAPINLHGAQARVNIFDIPKVVHLVLTESYVGKPVLMNYPINRTDFTLIRGVSNTIQFFVRDVDRKIVTGPLANATLTINIVDTSTDTILMQRNLFSVDAANSLYGVSTQPTDLLTWPTGALQYSIQVMRQDGTQSLLWTDRNYTPYGYCTIIDGPLPAPATPTTLDPSTFLSDMPYRYSTALPGTASKGYPDGLQTFSFYTTAFTGNVAIQASLVEQPSTELSNWFDVTYQPFMMANGVTAVNLEGNYLWVRVAVPMMSNGVIDKITFLN